MREVLRTHPDGVPTAPPRPSAPPPPEAGPADLPQVDLPVAAVARRLGVAPATLRTWARRYGLGPSRHDAGAHRRYAPADVARLETMRRLTLAGVAPGEAAAAALAEPDASPSARGPLPDREGRVRRGGPGGKVLALPGADEVVRGLGRAAMALDSDAVLEGIRTQLDEHGVVHTWEHVLRPVLAASGARWAATGEGVEVEHLLSDCVTTALRERAARAPAAPSRPVLLASGPDELHALPLHAIAAGLAELDRGSRVLGPSLPAGALEASVRRTGAGRAVRLVAAAGHRGPRRGGRPARHPSSDGDHRRRAGLAARGPAGARGRGARPAGRRRAVRPGHRRLTLRQAVARSSSPDRVTRGKTVLT